MKYLGFILAVMIFSSCQQTTHKSAAQHSGTANKETGNFGQEILTEQAVPATQLLTLFGDADSVNTVISGNITASCKHTGCWMELDMGEGKTVHVTFADEAFTIPLDAAGKNAIAEGVAIREMVPVETLRNYARDDGKSEEEIAAITEPAYNYEFIANGVLIEE